eukprot:scaffold1142_cov387-Prasinococcus_capsulatus_cf.AAC.5
MVRPRYKAFCKSLTLPKALSLNTITCARRRPGLSSRRSRTQASPASGRHASGSGLHSPPRGEHTVTGILWWTAVASSLMVYSAPPSPAMLTTLRSMHAFCAPMAVAMPQPSVPWYPEDRNVRGL